MDIYHDQLNANKEKFEKVYNDKISELTNYRNAVLSAFGIVISILGVLLTIDIFKNLLQLYLSIVVPTVVVSVLTIYISFTVMKQKMDSKLLNIQRAFHDGYTTINFMKSFVHKLVLIDQLNEDQVYALSKYYTIIQGGIVKRIRRKIKENIGKKKTEKDFYGESEYELYSLLIERACSLYEDNKNKEDLLRIFEKNDPRGRLFSIYNNFYLNELI